MRVPAVCLSAWILQLLALSNACIYKYGTAPDSLAAPHGGTHWNHAFSGDDWVGKDANRVPWVCMSGKRQSPINIPEYSSFDSSDELIPPNLWTQWNYPDLVSDGTNIEVINNGHTIQVEWLYPYAGEVKIAVPANYDANTKITSVLNMHLGDNFTTVTAKPVQFHFHTTSEHLVAGKYYPLELHIVHKITDLPVCAAGCYSVTGILFELTSSGDNPLLTKLWNAMPMRAGVINYLPANATVKLGSLMPRKDARQYITYEGSLTTPPCSEGLLWHVMTTPQKISYAQWRKYKSAVGFKECTLKGSSESGDRHDRRSNRRMLGEDPEGNPNDYNCTLAAYGTNFRTSQPKNGRIVKLSSTVKSV